VAITFDKVVTSHNTRRVVEFSCRYVFTKLRWVLAAVVVAMGVTNAWSQAPKPDLKSTPGLSDAFARAVRGFDKTPRGTFFASQPSQGYQAELSAKGGLTLSTGKTRFGVSVTAFGRGAQRGQLGETTVKAGKDLAGWPQLSFNRSQLSEWYVNEQSGLHHWLRVEKRPAASGNLWVRLGVTGDIKLKSISDTAVEVHSQSTVLTYAGLKVWDARGKVLPARLEVERQNINIVVEDSTAIYPLTIDPEWVQTQKLFASDGKANEYFGESVAISGLRAVIGASNSAPAGIQDAGAVYVFKRDGFGAWNQEAKLTAPDKSENDRFGFSVGIDGDRIAVGAFLSSPNNTLNAGAVYVFSRSTGAWLVESKLTAEDKTSGDKLGHSVSVNGDRILAGAVGNDPAGLLAAGAAYVFVRNVSAVWSQEAKLTCLDKAAEDNFGYSVSLNGERALVGAFRSDPGNLTEAGAAYVFLNNGSSSWTQEAKLAASDKHANDRFGISVSLYGSKALIGAQDSSPDGLSGAGSAYMFARTENSWSQITKLTASDKIPNGQFGASVSLSNSKALIGSYFIENGAGAAYVFADNNGSWLQVAKLVASDRAPFDYLGLRVSLDGNRALVGAPRSDPGGVDGAGAAYIFAFNGELDFKFSSRTVPVGDGISCTIATELPAPTGGLTISLSADNPALTVPATVTIPAGTTSVTFNSTANSVLTDTPVLVTASAPGYDDGTATVTVQPRIEASEFVSQTVQNTYYATNQHPVSVTMKNTGTTTWTRTTHRLVSMNPFNNSVWGRTDVLIPTGVSIAPGQSHTFAFNITAPATAGNYNFQWQMRKVSPGVPTNFGQTSTNVLVSVLTGFNAEFFSQSVPTALEPGKKVDVQIVMRNRGSTTWTPDNVRLLSKTNPLNLFGKDSIQLLPGESIAPGRYKTFNFRIQAPAAEGDYVFKWQMRRLGVANFGPETPTVSIHVQALYNSQFVSQTVPATMQTANSYPVSVTFTNTGTAIWAPGQYVLYSQNAPGNNRWRVNAVPLPSSVAPGASLTFNFTVYAPLTPGTYNFQWRLRKSGTGDFGALSTNVPVVVTN
jgi:hypothetical protein